MMTMLLGKVGSGKSLFAMRLLVGELRATDRRIWTTLAVDVDRLNEYVQALYPDEDLRVVQRVFRLADKKMLDYFWRFRNQESALGEFGSADWEPGRGIAYFLDEVQVSYGARNWASRSGEVTEYITQHRKCGDDIICCTPFSGLVDKQFRAMAMHQAP